MVAVRLLVVGVQVLMGVVAGIDGEMLVVGMLVLVAGLLVLLEVACIDR